MKSFLLFALFSFGSWYLKLSSADPVLFPAEIGDKCPGGFCDLVHNCPQVVRNIHNRVLNHTVCGFQGIYQIICCPHKVLDTTDVVVIKDVLEVPKVKEKLSGIEELLRTAFSEGSPFTNTTECITNNGHEPGLVKFRNHCPEAVVDNSAASVCGYDICHDAVCCPHTVNNRRTKSITNDAATIN